MRAAIGGASRRVTDGSTIVAISSGSRILSAYETRDGARLWIITEAEDDGPTGEHDYSVAAGVLNRPTDHFGCPSDLAPFEDGIKISASTCRGPSLTRGEPIACVRCRAVKRANRPFTPTGKCFMTDSLHTSQIFEFVDTSPACRVQDVTYIGERMHVTYSA